MPTPIRRIGLLTGGGDCPGLNAVIRAVTLEALNHGIEVVGFLDGFQGVIEDRVRTLPGATLSPYLARIRAGAVVGYAPPPVKLPEIKTPRPDVTETS